MSFVSTLDFNYEPAKDTWGRRKCWAKVDAKEGDLGKEKAVKITSYEKLHICQVCTKAGLFASGSQSTNLFEKIVFFVPLL